jgi:hypothetical protein
MSEMETLDEAYSRGRDDGLEDAMIEIKLDIKPTLDDYERRIDALEVKWQAMMTKFQPGQIVEVWEGREDHNVPNLWRKARIVSYAFHSFPKSRIGPQMFDVEFPDGSKGMFDEEHIRDFRYHQRAVE